MRPLTILEEQFPVRNVPASIIGNGVIWLLWQLRCYCNPDHNKFSSLSNTTVVAIFPNVCLWYRSLCSKKTSQVLTCIKPLSYASTAYVVASYGPRFCSTVLQKFGQLARIIWANGLPPPPPPTKNCPYAYDDKHKKQWRTLDTLTFI